MLKYLKTNLFAQIDQWGKLEGDRAAHVSGSRMLTWGELVAKSDALAKRLAAAVPSGKDPIVVLGHKEPEMLIAFLGCVKCGHPYVPVDVSLPPQRVEKIINAAKSPLVLTPEKVEQMLAEPDVVRGSEARRMGGDDPFYIIFTSGSTGDPKGVVITLNCLEAFVDWQLGEQHLLAGDKGEGRQVFLNQAPFSFDLSVMDLYSSLASGGTLFSLTRDQIASPRQMYESLGRSGLTFWVSTPSFAQMCLVEKSFGPAMLPALATFWFCGETLPPDVAAALLDRFPSAAVWNTYGPTEATVATTSIKIDAALLRQYPALPVGRAMAGTRVWCRDEQGIETPEDERGEVVIAGPNVSPGYFGRPDLTAKVFGVEGPVRSYRTGDWGRQQDGLIFFEGRMDNQVKLHGYRIELGDIEANLQSIPGVRDAAVVPVVKSGVVDSLAAFVISTTSVAPEGEFEAGLALKSRLGQMIPAYMVPRKFIFMNSFPMTANGKADRRALSLRLG